MNYEWSEKAPCWNKTELFFDKTREREAKALCAECDFTAECLELALGYESEHGVWGRTNQIERRRIQLKRARARHRAWNRHWQPAASVQSPEGERTPRHRAHFTLSNLWKTVCPSYQRCGAENMRDVECAGSRSSVRVNGEQEGDWDGRWIFSRYERIGRNEDVGDALLNASESSRGAKIRKRQAEAPKEVTESGLQYERRSFDVEAARQRAAGAL